MTGTARPAQPSRALMPCAGCAAARDREEELESALREARARVVKAVRDAARAQTALDEQRRADAEFKARLAAVQAREAGLHEELGESRRAAKEAQWKAKRLAAALERSNGELRDLKLRGNARLATLSESLEATESAARAQRKRLRLAADRVRSTALDLRRHLGSRGFHAVNSQTARRLIGNIVRATSGLASAARARPASPAEDPLGELEEEEESDAGSDNECGHRLAGLSARAARQTLKLAARGGKVRVVGDTPSHELMQQLSDLCRDLEAENERLRGKLEAAKEAGREAGPALVRKYRLAIVKVRTQARKLQHEVASLAAENASLRAANEQHAKRGLLISAARKAREALEAKLRTLESTNAGLRDTIEQYRRADKSRRAMLATIRAERAAFSTPTPSRGRRRGPAARGDVGTAGVDFEFGDDEEGHGDGDDVSAVSDYEHQDPLAELERGSDDGPEPSRFGLDRRGLDRLLLEEPGQGGPGFSSSSSNGTRARPTEAKAAAAAAAAAAEAATGDWKSTDEAEALLEAELISISGSVDSPTETGVGQERASGHLRAHVGPGQAVPASDERPTTSGSVRSLRSLLGAGAGPQDLSMDLRTLNAEIAALQSSLARAERLTP